MKKLFIAVVCCVALSTVSAQAKTFVGVLWPMFGPLPAVGLVELVAELKMMPDVEVSTYLHQSWPSLVRDLRRQPPGTRTVVIGYSLGANSTVSVANHSKYIDLVIALQPSMFSWNPKLTGDVGKMIEIYNPNRWETFGGMGSKKLIGPHIEYIANSDSHPGAQFSWQFRHLVKSEIAKLSAEPEIVTAAAQQPSSPEADATPTGALAFADASAPRRPVLPAAFDAPTKGLPFADPSAPRRAATPDAGGADHAARHDPTEAAQPPADDAEKELSPVGVSPDVTAFLDALSSGVNSGDLSAARRLTAADMTAYAQKIRGTPATSDVR